MAREETSPIRLVIHGGAGAIARARLKAEVEQAYVEVLEQSLAAGYSLLSLRGSSTDAVIAASLVMEDSPLFNAGKGAVFSNGGRVELDAAIMDGSSLMAGSVAAVTTIRNPIGAAHAVVTQSPHVMLMGEGADAFGAEKVLEIVDPSYFHTEFSGISCKRLSPRNGWYAITTHFPISRTWIKKRMRNGERSVPWHWIAMETSLQSHRLGALQISDSDVWGTRRSSALEPTRIIVRSRYPRRGPEKCSSVPQRRSTQRHGYGCSAFR